MRKLRAEMHRRMLGNGYGARPVGMDCHFESICESCTFFQTTIELSASYSAVQQQLGYQQTKAPATAAWLRLAAAAAIAAAGAALVLNRRLPA